MISAYSGGIPAAEGGVGAAGQLPGHGISAAEDARGVVEKAGPSSHKDAPYDI